jgi:hypothetical protein
MPPEYAGSVRKLTAAERPEYPGGTSRGFEFRSVGIDLIASPETLAAARERINKQFHISLESYISQMQLELFEKGYWEAPKIKNLVAYRLAVRYYLKGETSAQLQDGKFAKSNAVNRNIATVVSAIDHSFPPKKRGPKQKPLV